MHDTHTTACVDAFLCAGACTLEPFGCSLFFVVFLLYCCLFTTVLFLIVFLCFSCWPIIAGLFFFSALALIPTAP
ncbi:hypothetical protein TCDM_09611 [Trypanosoma cruzi Dm28c]|uniref:Uncharacterized protein n=1 Tax=Trypanosoma cruzi Dm28c TaxID=1416333 RepID=V5B508_TRYCR|nr:hypothetical protein TCDM_09611 [Trypanosoma cruzi Dm28c]